MTRMASAASALIGVFALHNVPALAHHSFAMFNPTKIVTLTGAVKELQWTAPHVMIWLVEDPKEGEAAGGKLWSVELSTSPGPLTRLGWNRQSVKPGDRVTIEINPLRSGNPGGAFKKLTILSTGEVLVSGAVGAEVTAQPAASPVPAETK
jgi:Family of unknown function (DUF6152)